MKTPINNDNIYKISSTIYATEKPLVKLSILDYKSRIYYCHIVDGDDNNVLAYFERELIPDVQSPK